jgi:hypothetical protein
MKLLAFISYTFLVHCNYAIESNCSNGVHVSSFTLGYCEHNLLCVAIIRVVPWKYTLTTKTRDEDQGPKREAKYSLGLGSGEHKTIMRKASSQSPR